MKSSDDRVYKFWNNNFLGKGVFKFENDGEEFFENHSRLSDSQTTFRRYLPDFENLKILDIACGVGYWLDKYNTHSNPKMLIGVDISKSAIEICNQRFNDGSVKLFSGDAENLKFLTDQFNFISCHGALHHMENPKLALLEINRLLKKDGVLQISIYYKNIFFKIYDKSKIFRKILFFIFKGIRGRGRENFFQSQNSSELVRQFDGMDNPIGWAGEIKDLEMLLPSTLKISKISYEFSPSIYLLPFLPTFLHRLISRVIPLMMYIKLVKSD